MFNEEWVKRFWSKVKKSDGCWEWTSFRNTKGYGQVGHFHKLYYAHRASWIIKNGEIPKGMCALHKCDNPPCVRPDHLFLGTKLDNWLDQKKKGHIAKGYDLPQTKLTIEKVKEIRSLYKKNVFGFKNVAKRTGIPVGNVYHIITRHTWNHIKD